MATLTSIVPSGLTNGKPAKVAANATPGTTFHAAHATALDEIWMWLSNTSNLDVVATVELGGVTSPDNHVKITVPANDTVVAVAGARVTGSVTVAVFAATANVITMHGNVNRYAA